MNFKKFIPYAIAVVIFAIASLLYFNPVLSGKQMKQSDITQFIGMSKEIKDYRVETGEEPYWLGNAFSGMPAYQVSAYYPNDIVRYIDKAIRFLPRPADYLFLYFLGFFVLLTAFKVDWKLAILGSLSFGFSTYLIIIFGAGHNAKAHAIAYMPLVMAGVIYVFKRKYLLGFVLTAIAMSLEIYASHPQMTYYLGFIILILGIVELIKAYKNKVLPTFGKQVAVLMLAFVLGIATNASRLLAMKEYTQYSTRGASELTVNADGTPKEKSSGLDKTYITEYSYGVWETFNLMIPRFMGGGTFESLDEDSNFYKTLEQVGGPQAAREYSKQSLTYWGTQPFVEAPAYIGAILFFLFFLGVFLVDKRIRNWLIAATILSIVLSWGKNFSIITNFFIDYIPLYNKFRAVSSIQVIAEICIPLLGILGLKEFLSENAKISKEEKFEALKKSVFISGGLALFFMLFGGSLFAFEGIRDTQYQEAPVLIDALISDRKSMLFNDSLRSLLLIVLSGLSLWVYQQNKIKRDVVILSLGALVLFDLVSFNLNYVNKEDFVSKRKVNKPFTATKADNEILKDKSYYRVANFSSNLMSDGRTSYFHNSIGGYHAAKLKRYNELFEYQIAKNNMEILNMLNTKYFIVSDNDVQVNPEVNGNVWFVGELKYVDSADEEIKALDSINTKTTAVLRSNNSLKLQIEKDSTATISLKSYSPTKLEYVSSTSKNQFAVFSEIYYNKGWKAYIDGEEMPYYQVDYVLRGMGIPSGNHSIVFEFKPQVINTGAALSLVAYALLLIVPIGWFFYDKKRN